MKRHIISLILMLATIGSVGVCPTAGEQPTALQAPESIVNVVPACQPVTQTSKSGNYRIDWQVASSGGRSCNSVSYRLSGTACQTAVGAAGAVTYGMKHGYWQPCCVCLTRGNVDESADCLVTMGDLTVMIDYLFITLTPLVCPDAGNVDLSEDGLITMGDLTVLIDNLFITLTPLPPCP